MEKIYELNKYVKFQLYTVDKLYVLQLFEPNDNPNDVDVSCIWENDNFDLDYLFDEAIEWCKERIEDLDKEEYKNFCVLMNKIWEEHDIQKQLIEKGYAHIIIKPIDIPSIRYGSTFYDYYIYRKCQSKIEHLKKGNNLSYKNDTYYKFKESFWEKELNETFHLDKDLLDRFMKENSLSYEIGAIVHGINKRIFISKSAITKIFPVINIYLWR